MRSLSNAATGAAAVCATLVKPSGTALMASKWLIHTDCSAGSPSRRRPPSTVSAVRPYSPAS
jgi:hypothetical protein